MLIDEIQLSTDQIDMLVKGIQSMGFYGKEFYPRTFWSPWEPGHQPILDIIDSKADLIAIKALRGIGKTSIAKGIVCRALHYCTARFVCYVSQTEGKAMLETEDIKAKMVTCKHKGLFVPVKIHRNATITGLEQDFSKKLWVYGDQSVILPRGAGQQVLGLNWHDFRPDLLVFDDLVDKATVGNPRIREDLHKWFFGDVMETRAQYKNVYEGDLDVPNQGFKVIYIDTYKHSDDLLEHLFKDPEFKCINVQICDPVTMKTNFPLSRPQEDLDKRVKDAEKRGRLDQFYMNFLGLEPDLQNIKFNRSMFKYYDESHMDFLGELRHKEVLNIAICDPAGTINSVNARTAITVIGLNLTRSKMYLRESVPLNVKPRDFYKAVADRVRKYRVQYLGVEFTGLNEYIKQPIEDMISTESLDVEPIWLTPRQVEVDGRIFSSKKIVRIGALHPYYQSGNVYHNVVGLEDYEKQLEAYPGSVGMIDLIDSAAYIVQILNQLDLVFDPDNTKFDLDKYNEDLKELYSEEQYRNIRYDPPIPLVIRDGREVIGDNLLWYDHLAVPDELAI